MKISLFILFIAVIWSCERKNDSLTSISALDTTRYYLPLDKFADTSSYVGQDTFLVAWYSEMLKALKEPVLINKTGAKEIYRLTWLRTFHNPVAIRIEKKGEQYGLHWKLCNGAGGYEPGELVIDKSKEISRKEWDRFIQLLQKTNFWSMETTEREQIGTDGSEWIIEGVSAGRYHVVDRWTPRKNDYFNCGDYLISLTDLEIQSDDKY